MRKDGINNLEIDRLLFCVCAVCHFSPSLAPIRPPSPSCHPHFMLFLSLYRSAPLNSSYIFNPPSFRHDLRYKDTAFPPSCVLCFLLGFFDHCILFISNRALSLACNCSTGFLFFYFFIFIERWNGGAAERIHGNREAI